MPESYTVQLTLHSHDDTGAIGRELLREVAEEVLDWASGAEGLPEGSEFPHYGEWKSEALGTYVVSGNADGALEWWEMEWARPDHQRRAIWVSQVQLATEGDEVEARVRVSGRAEPGRITPRTISVRRPNLVPRLVTKFHATYYGDRVDAMPLPPVSAQRVSRLVERLEDPARRLPVVLISMPRGASIPRIAPQHAADQLAGLAEVALLPDDSASWQLTQRVGRQLACFWGAARLYWPGFQVSTEDPYVHRLWLAKRVEEQSPRGVIDHMFNILCSRVARASGELPIWEAVREGINTRADARTRARLEELGEDSELRKIAEETLKTAEASRTTAERQARDLESDLKGAHQRIEELEGELRDQKKQWNVVQNYGADDSEPSDELPAVTSVLDAVEFAQLLDHIRFLPRVRKTAKASPFNSPEDVYQSFLHLEELATERMAGSVGSIEEWLAQRGVDYAAKESRTTRPKRRFKDNIKQETLLFQEHLKFGTGFDARFCLRVQMAWDGEAGEWVIAHVGEHLDNTKTS